MRFIALVPVLFALSACGVESAEIATADGSADLRQVDCSAVRCMETCPEGEVYRQPHGNSCCGTCVPARGNGNGNGNNIDQCTDAVDCEGLVHVMCLGSWSCDRGTCNYTCDSTVL